MRLCSDGGMQWPCCASLPARPLHAAIAAGQPAANRDSVSSLYSFCTPPDSISLVAQSRGSVKSVLIGAQMHSILGWQWRASISSSRRRRSSSCDGLRANFSAIHINPAAGSTSDVGSRLHDLLRKRRLVLCAMKLHSAKMDPN